MPNTYTLAEMKKLGSQIYKDLLGAEAEAKENLDSGEMTENAERYERGLVKAYSEAARIVRDRFSVKYIVVEAD